MQMILHKGDLKDEFKDTKFSELHLHHFKLEVQYALKAVGIETIVSPEGKLHKLIGIKTIEESVNPILKEKEIKSKTKSLN